MPTDVRVILRCAALGLALLGSTLAHAEIEASLDLRLVESDGRDSFLDGGLGKLRFDTSDDGLQLGRARLAWRGSLGGNWHANVDLSAWSLRTTTTPSISPKPGWNGARCRSRHGAPT